MNFQSILVDTASSNYILRGFDFEAAFDELYKQELCSNSLARHECK